MSDVIKRTFYLLELSEETVDEVRDVIHASFEFRQGAVEYAEQLMAAEPHRYTHYHITPIPCFVTIDFF